MTAAKRIFSLFILASSAFLSLPAQAQQSYNDVDLGARNSGQSYPITLRAENRNCIQLLDFRFTSHTPWIKLPADPVARQIPQGQSRTIQAQIDLTDVPAGRHEGFFDVDCENCGFLIFKNCKVDKQQFRILVLAQAAASVAADPQAQPGRPADLNASVDPNDPRLPPPVRKRLIAANAALEKANKKKGPCEEELKKLQAAAADAQKAADEAAKADADAADAEQKRKDALAEANKAAAAAEAAAKTAEEMKGHPQYGPESKDAAEKAEADRKAAAAAATEAQKAADAAKKAAKKTDAAATAKAAADAQAAADAKAEECDKAAAAADAAAAAAAEAEADARDALNPPQPKAASQIPSDEEIERLRQEAEDCWRACEQMARDQRIALETLEELGALQDQADLDQWTSDYNEIIDGVGDILSELGVPGTDYGGLLAKGSLVAIAAGAKIGNSRHIPGSPSHDADATKKWLQGKGKGADERKVTDPKQAERVYKEMERYTQGNKDGPTTGMRNDLEKAKAACNAAEQKYKDAKKAAGK